MHSGTSLYQSWRYFFALQILTTAFAYAVIPMTAPLTDNENIAILDKREANEDMPKDWTTYKQPWGKREANEDMPKDWTTFKQPWGKREAYDDMPTDWTTLKHPWGKREAYDDMPKDWTTFKQPWGKREANLNTAAIMEQLSNYENGDANDNIFNQKRGWKNMNVAWGKRRNAGDFESSAGSWGKRQPSWNNLKGMWGKRAASRNENWNALRGSWGKRSAQIPQIY